MPGSVSRTDLSDWRLFDAKIRASLAYADALVEPGVISSAERDQLAVALRKITQERDAGAAATSRSSRRCACG